MGVRLIVVYPESRVNQIVTQAQVERNRKNLNARVVVIGIRATLVLVLLLEEIQEKVEQLWRHTIILVKLLHRWDLQLISITLSSQVGTLKYLTLGLHFQGRERRSVPLLREIISMERRLAHVNLVQLCNDIVPLLQD